jgi:hypothetical protein
MRTDKKIQRMFVLRPQTIEALDRLVPAGDRSAYVDGLIAQHLGVERDIVKIVEKNIEKNIERCASVS